jgi:murein DD-endopeptidase MepM/ murein hydrolase activator NlpD
MDIAAAEGTPIRAVRDGTVTFAGERGGYGLVVYVDHGDGLQTRYAHCSRLHVKPGQKITQGQLLSEVGSTGRSTGNHLHFEARKNGVAVDPKTIFNWRDEKSTKTQPQLVRQHRREGL